MATVREVITRALRRIRVVGLLESPSSEIEKHTLSAFNDMLSAYEADGLTTETVILTGNTSVDSRTVTGLNGTLYSAGNLVVGMEVNGTGVSARVHEIKSDNEIVLSDVATATGTAVTLTFSALPMDDSLTQALVAVLAVRMAGDFGATVDPVLAHDARHGQAQIDGAFLKVPTKGLLDQSLVRTSSRRFYDGRG